MKATIEDLKDTFKVGYEAYEDSYEEALATWELYHNRQYTQAQLDTLANRGQPAETFNIIKMFAHMTLGYYSTVVNKIIANPVHYRDVNTASLATDIADFTFRDNHMETEGDKIKLDGLISGIMCAEVSVINTDDKDEFGRVHKRIKLSHVAATELVLDPMSKLEDYSDARFIHRFKWMSEDAVLKLFGKAKMDKLESYYNHLNVNGAEFTAVYNQTFSGQYRVFDNYLIVNSVLQDDNGVSWNIWWSGDYILKKQRVEFEEVRFNYRVQKIAITQKAEYYGRFHDVIESQKAINQAIIKIQLMINTQKALVEEGAVENLAEFTDAFNRVNSVMQVLDLNGIEIVNTAREVLDQYVVIDKALTRVQQVLGINDSFLGQAFASDSGRKVKLQQNQTILALNPTTNRVNQFYRLLGWDIINLAKQYYNTHQVLRIVDDSTGQRWVELNQPYDVWNGQRDEAGQPVMQHPMQEAVDAQGDVVTDEDDIVMMEPVTKPETEIKASKFSIEIQVSAYNDEDEKNQLMMETVLSGTGGTLLSQLNPSGYMTAMALSIKTMKTKHSGDIAAIFEQTAQMLSGDPQAEAGASAMAAGLPGQGTPKSSQLKLPQNTNEGL
jgi:hypothetical protein